VYQRSLSPGISGKNKYSYWIIEEVRKMNRRGGKIKVKILLISGSRRIVNFFLALIPHIDIKGFLAVFLKK
jgi:hypothetical protein